MPQRTSHFVHHTEEINGSERGYSGLVHCSAAMRVKGLVRIVAAAFLCQTIRLVLSETIVLSSNSPSTGRRAAGLGDRIYLEDGTLWNFEGQANEREERGVSFNTFIHNIDYLGVLGGMAATVTLSGVSANSGISGTLALNQSKALSNLKVQGTITGLPANQVFNIHARRNADVSSDCANQGDFMNPTNTSASGGFLVTSATADATGSATIDASVAAADVTLYKPKGITSRSVRVAAGSKSATGTILACGAVTSLT